MKPSAPSREELLTQLAAANARGRTAVGVCCVVLIASSALVNWEWLVAAPWPSLTYVAVLGGGYAALAIMLAGKKRKQVRDLKPETRFGEYDREALLALVADAEDRLDIPRDKYRVYVTRDKTLNAGALSLGLDTLLGGVDGVYLHRQLLHVLRPQELAFVIGHELGHCHRHYLVWLRWGLVQMATVAMVGLALLPYALTFGWLGVFGLGMLSTAVVSALQAQSASISHTIEHLCDDHGAQAASVPAAVNALLKLGAESEGWERVTRFCLEMGKQRKDLDPADVMQQYEESIPFGSLDREEADRVLAASVREVQRKNSTVSLRGLYEYLSEPDSTDDDHEEELAQQRAIWKRLDAANVIDWSRPLRETDATELTPRQIDQVVAALEANPKAILNRTSDEIAPSDSHPTPRDRLLFLWKNRTAIEKAS